MSVSWRDYQLERKSDLLHQASRANYNAPSIADAVQITRQTSLPCRREDLERVPFAEAGM
jgi:hypothetical protein